MRLPQVAEANPPRSMDVDGEDLPYAEFRANRSKRRNLMLWTIIVILVILWLLGFLGGNISPSFPKTGNWIHTLIVIALILIVLNVLGII